MSNLMVSKPINLIDSFLDHSNWIEIGGPVALVMRAISHSKID